MYLPWKNMTNLSIIVWRCDKNQEIPGSPTKKSPKKRPPNRELDHQTAKYWKDHDQPNAVPIPIGKSNF